MSIIRSVINSMPHRLEELIKIMEIILTINIT